MILAIKIMTGHQVTRTLTAAPAFIALDRARIDVRSNIVNHTICHCATVISIDALQNKG